MQCQRLQFHWDIQGETQQSATNYYAETRVN